MGILRMHNLPNMII